MRVFHKFNIAQHHLFLPRKVEHVAEFVRIHAHNRDHIQLNAQTSSDCSIDSTENLAQNAFFAHDFDTLFMQRIKRNIHT